MTMLKQLKTETHFFFSTIRCLFQMFVEQVGHLFGWKFREMKSFNFKKKKKNGEKSVWKHKRKKLFEKKWKGDEKGKTIKIERVKWNVKQTMTCQLITITEKKKVTTLEWKRRKRRRRPIIDHCVLREWEVIDEMRRREAAEWDGKNRCLESIEVRRDAARNAGKWGRDWRLVVNPFSWNDTDHTAIPFLEWADYGHERLLSGLFLEFKCCFRKGKLRHFCWKELQKVLE